MPAAVVAEAAVVGISQYRALPDAQSTGLVEQKAGSSSETARIRMDADALVLPGNSVK